MPGGRVIGGEYSIGVGSLCSGSSQKRAARYSLGRTCLYTILNALKLSGADINGGVLLPDYICSSVAGVPGELGMEVKHYHINAFYEPDYSSIKGQLKSSRVILLVTYFGMVDVDGTIRKIRSEFPGAVIIVDDVMNCYGFGGHADYDYCFTSYRKWFPVPDGAEIMQKDGTLHLEEFKGEAAYVAYKIAGNLLKNYRGVVGDQACLGLLEAGEAMMDEGYLFHGSSASAQLLSLVDYEAAKDRRMRNAKALHNGLVKMGVKHLYKEGRAPLFVPIAVRGRDGLRKAFFENGIFTPVHWPLKDRALQGSNDLYGNELSLICDQRYDEGDMDEILGVLRNGI